MFGILYLIEIGCKCHRLFAKLLTTFYQSDFFPLASITLQNKTDNHVYPHIRITLKGVPQKSPL